ncbi:MAG: RagB/SusD family nutrient uptake outer membrane protein [Pyrinomonadaceae bacterium]|nr:RagB/SusD family nutrient uptake outer membrane protein [Sphingobacteriaceae bacterium]
MKNIIKLSYLSGFPQKLLLGFIGLLPIILSVSCNKALIEAPKSLAVEVFYNTSAEVEAATNAIYAPLLSQVALPGYIALLEAQTDYGLGRGSYLPLNEFDGFNATNESRAASIWELFYQSIRNANLVIKNAPNGKDISKAAIDRYVGEAKFLRAFDYFHLVRNFAGVPIRTEANMTEIAAKRATVAEVYTLIVDDLTAAENTLPDNPAQSGRPSKWAAKTLLADVYLEMAKYTEARDKADEVIKANKYSLVSVTTVDDWQKIFGPDVVTTPEEIFYIKCTRQTLYGNYWVMFPNHPGTRFHASGGFFGHHSDANNLVYKNQDAADLRKGLWYIWNIGLGPNSLLNKKFIDPLAVSATGAGNDMPWYRYSDLLLIYAEAASRANNGPTVAAVEALNKVHRRAYGQNPNSPSTVDFILANYNATTFLDLIIKERGYEFQYEGKRWLELKRTGKAAEIILAVKGKTILQKAYLWPIPITEIPFNPALDPVKDQNPGY